MPRKRGRTSGQQFAVIGLGRFGASVARTLSSMGYEVLAVDSSEERIQDLASQVTHVVQADATDEEAMRALGLRNFDIVVVAVGDIQASILTTLILKEIGAEYIVCKAVSQLHGKVLEKVGADRVVFPERDMGERVAHNLVSGNLIDYIELAPGYSIVEVVARDALVGHTLRELDLRAKYGIDIVAIRRGDRLLIAPGAQDRILEGDVLVAIGEDEMLERLETGDARATS